MVEVGTYIEQPIHPLKQTFIDAKIMLELN